jgi:dephospho-CoA kinase
MTEIQFAAILARQMPDPQKRALATHIVETLDLASTQSYVTALIAHIRGQNA